jgi:pimeloyl-ACP methyl ester carboxylesterase
MGGLVGLVVTNGRHAAPVSSVFAFGLKIAWTDGELARLAEVAGKPARLFPTREEAEARFLRVLGLEGLVSADASVIGAGIVQDGDGYRLAADPRTVLVAVTGPSAEDAWRASTVPRRLACGGRDELVTLDEMRVLDPDAIALGGMGHNVHLEDPGLLLGAVPFLHGRV